MTAVRVHTTLGPELLALPEVASLLGQEVHVTLVPARRVDVPPVATEFIEQCKAFVAAHGPGPTIEEVREMLSVIPGSLYDREDD